MFTFTEPNSQSSLDDVPGVVGATLVGETAEAAGVTGVVGA